MIENETLITLPERVETSVTQWVGQANLASTGTANVAVLSGAIQQNAVYVVQGNQAVNAVV